MTRGRSAAAGAALLALIASACGEKDREADTRGDPSEAALAAWAERPGRGDVTATVTFPRPVHDSVAAAFLSRHSLKPWAALMTVGDVSTRYSEERTAASLEVLDRARARAATDLTVALCAQQGRARRLLATGSEEAAPADREELRRLLSRVEQLEDVLPDVPRGAPILRAVRVTATVDDLRAARREGDSITVEVPPPAAEGTGEGEAGLPDLTAPAGDEGVLPRYASMGETELEAEASELASGGLERCHDYPARETGPGGG